MGRIINTGDIHNRIQAYPGLGVFRDEILSIVSRVVMECPTAKDDMVVYEIVDRVLEIIDAEMDEVNCIEPKYWLMLNKMRGKVLNLKGGEQE